MSRLRRAFVPVIASGGASDTTAPTVVITSTESSPTGANPIPITITFSEPVTGFVVGDITVSSGTLNTFAGTGAAYTVNWVPAVIGTMTMDIAGGVCVDGAGNANTAATQFSIFETTVTAGAITPTLGSELLANPGFEGTYDDETSPNGFLMLAPNWSNNGCETDGTDLLSKELTTIHGGSASQKAVVNAATEGFQSDQVSITIANWYQIFVWINITSGQVNLANSGARLPFNKSLLTTGSFIQHLLTARSTSTGSDGPLIRSTGGAATFYADDASLKLITFTTMRSSVGAAQAKNGTYLAHPTVAGGTQCGIIIEYQDDNNFVILEVSREGNSAAAKLISRIAGTYTEARTGNITYVAGQELKAVVSGTTHQLFYNSVQVGADATIDNSGMGTGVYGWNSYAGNTVGSVTANP